MRVREEFIVPLFARHFSDTEVNALLEFYRSPVARKLVSLTPELMRESSDATSRYFDRAAERVREELEADVDEKTRALRTIAEMRTIATAIEGMALEVGESIDRERVPRLTNAEELRPLFEAAGSLPGRLQTDDGWGRPFVILLSEDAARYRIISAGADGLFETDSRTLSAGAPPADPPTVWTEGYDADIIYEDRSFIRRPSETRMPWDG